MRKVGVGMALLLAGCTAGTNSDPGSVTTTAPTTTTAAPELTTTTSEAPTTTVAPEPTTVPAPEEFSEVVESSTTTVYARKVAPATTIVKENTSDSGSSLASGELASIRACESGGVYTTNTGNGYYGAYQFDLQTWQAAGGSGNPANASPAEQDMRAQAWIDAGYRGAWPNC